MIVRTQTRRVYIPRTIEIPDPDGGGPTIYHGDRQFDLPARMADEFVRDGKALEVDLFGVPVQPAPPADEDPQPVAEPAAEGEV